MGFSKIFLKRVMFLTTLTLCMVFQPIFGSTRENNYVDMLTEEEFHGNKIQNLDSSEYYRANRTFLLKQRVILRVLRHVQCPSVIDHGDLYYISKTYNPKNHLRDYKDPQLVKEYVEKLENGTYLSRSASFTTMNSDQLVKLSQILESTFTSSYELFRNTLAYFFTRVNMAELYSSLSFIISSLRTEGYRIPPPYEVYPQLFTPKDILYRLNEMELGESGLRPTVLESKRGPGLPEEPLAYFREDSSVNTFHLFWHLDFPFWYNETIHGVHKDRKGELFMYMHHQVMRRYLAHRVALGFKKIDAVNFTGPLEPGNSPNILDLDFREFPLRAPRVYMQDLSDITVSQLSGIGATMTNAINSGSFTYRNGSTVQIRNDQGSDILGNAIEASAIDSPDFAHYRSLHNLNHRFIAYVSDPREEMGLPLGVQAHQEASMTDPIFYRIHQYIDDFNKLQHDYLPSYQRTELEVSGIIINSLQVETQNAEINELQTYFHNVSWDITNAIRDCQKNVPLAKVFSNVKQLDHKDFQYNFDIQSDRNTNAVIRVFMASAVDFDKPADVDTLRWSFFEMDKILVQLQEGDNTITRKSSASSVTVPRYYSWKQINDKVERALFTNTNLYVNRYTRHCGWPHHQLLPQGSVNGTKYKLFAMVTEFDTDFNISFEEAVKLRSLSLCAVVKGSSPDRRPYGFPLERKIQSTWDDFLTENMITTDITIKQVESN